MTDFRALCAELAALDGHCVVDCTEEWADAMCRLRAALAKPEPQGPTLDCDEIEVPAWHRGDDFHVYKDGYTAGWAAGVNAAADCWGRPAIEPVPVAERLPGPEDCNADGVCWWWSRDITAWCLCFAAAGDQSEWTHWLPHHALPVPQNNA